MVVDSLCFIWLLDFCHLCPHWWTDPWISLTDESNFLSVQVGCFQLNKLCLLDIKLKKLPVCCLRFSVAVCSCQHVSVWVSASSLRPQRWTPADGWRLYQQPTRCVTLSPLSLIFIPPLAFFLSLPWSCCFDYLVTHMIDESLSSSAVPPFVSISYSFPSWCCTLHGGQSGDSYWRGQPGWNQPY